MSLPRFFDHVYWSVRYQRADDPTRGAVERVAAAASIELRVGDAAARDAGCREGIRVLTNLLPRTFGSIRLTVEPGLRGELVRLARAVNPEVDLGPEAVTHTVVWGDVGAAATIWAGGLDWTSSISRQRPVATAPNRAAGLVAGVLAYMEIFKTVFAEFLGDAWEPTQEAHLSLLTYAVTADAQPSGVAFPASTNIGEVHLVGVGAIGFAFLAALRAFPTVRGRLHVIDNQKVDLSNLQRYLLAYDADAMRQPKVSVAQRELRSTQLTVSPRQCTWERFVADQTGEWKFRRVVTALDSARARQFVQASLPLEVFNGGVTRSVFDVGHYGFDGVRECLNCAYQRTPTPPLFDLMMKTFGLGAPRLQQLEDAHESLSVQDVRVIEEHVRRPGELRHLVGLSLHSAYMRMCGFVIAESALAANEPALVPAAHVPVLAGVLLAVELLKASSPDLAAYRLRHVLQLDTRYRLEPGVRLDQGILLVAAPCICTDQDYQAAFRNKWGMTSATPKPQTAPA